MPSCISWDESRQVQYALHVQYGVHTLLTVNDMLLLGVVAG